VARLETPRLDGEIERPIRSINAGVTARSSRSRIRLEFDRGPMTGYRDVSAQFRTRLAAVLQILTHDDATSDVARDAARGIARLGLGKELRLW
jgi:hypothetical protein